MTISKKLVNRVIPEKIPLFDPPIEIRRHIGLSPGSFTDKAVPRLSQSSFRPDQCDGVRRGPNGRGIRIV